MGVKSSSTDELEDAIRGDAEISDTSSGGGTTQGVGHDLPKESKSKWGNEAAVSSDGHRFDSKLERDAYEYLRTLQEAGEITMIIRQTRLDLSPDRRMRVDFCVFWSDGSVSFLDAKGRATDNWKTKKDIAEDKYPIVIETLTREDLP